MWYLDHLTARNICSFRQLDYTLQQGVTTLIFGHNADNENQKSNGSGKSTLIEAIAFGITGSPLRKVRSEEIINDSAEACNVQLRFANRVTGEVLILEREIYRKGTSDVRCTLKSNGIEKEVVQASVDAYNKYILERLGITRDELFSSFILSKHRYQDFLSSSDKDKKDVINRFSNGILVDQAIAQVEADLEPLRAKLRDADLELAGIDGRIEMLSEQIRTEEDGRREKERSKQEKIDCIKDTIARKRALIRDCEAGIGYQKLLNDTVADIDKELQTLEDSDTPLGECIAGVRQILTPLPACKITDWTKIVATRNHEIADARTEIDKWTQIIANTGQKIARAQADLFALQSEYRIFIQDADNKDDSLKAEMQSLSERLSSANTAQEELQKRRRIISAAIETLNAKLAGTVTCPACGHEFLVSDEDFDVTGAQAELERRQTDLKDVGDNLLDSQLEAEKVEMMIVHVRNESRSLADFREQWKDRIAKGERAVQAAEYEMEGARFNIKRVQDFVAARTKEVEDMRRSLFDEAYEGIDTAKKTGERIIAEHGEQISAANSSIETLQQTITELETSTGSRLIASLKESLKSYRKKSAGVLENKTALESRVNALTTQIQVFSQFRTHLANTKINALSAMMNQVLADLGSDLRITLSGYTQLKSGAIREKISVSIIRDGMDCGSFGKFSEGEKMRVNLSSVIAMQRLVNGNCDVDKGLDLLVIDELGDSLDETGLASTFSAINKLGLTALVVSHGLTNEGYPYKLQIVKENGLSYIK